MTPPDAPPPAHRVPTLTEVIEIDGLRPAEVVEADLPAAAPAPLPSEAELVRRVMVEVQRQIDVMLEYRVREVLAPLLARAADTVVRDARAALASTLRDVVARAVDSELARLKRR